jgi:hypothetical protein
MTQLEFAKEEVKNLLVKMRIENPKVTITAAYIKYAKDKGYKSWNDLVIDYSKPHKVV